MTKNHSLWTHVDSLLNEPTLWPCSTSARWVWVAMFHFAWTLDEPGVLRVQGVNLNAKAISNVARCTEKEAVSALKELEKNRVFSRRPDGAIYCRRLVKDSGLVTPDAAKSERARLRRAGRPFGFDTAYSASLSFAAKGWTRINDVCAVGLNVDNDYEVLGVGDKSFDAVEVRNAQFSFRKDDLA